MISAVKELGNAQGFNHIFCWEKYVHKHPEARFLGHTVDGGNPADQLRLVVYAIIYRILYIPGGAEILPSTVS